MPKQSTDHVDPRRIDLSRVENIMQRTRGSLQKVYDTFGPASELYADSARKEMMRESLDIAKEILEKIQEKKNVMSSSELIKAYATLVSTANMLAERFNSSESKITDLPDAELEQLAQEEPIEQVM